MTILKSLLGPNDIEIPIDDSIFDFEIRISGDITKALLKDITGKSLIPGNIMDAFFGGPLGFLIQKNIFIISKIILSHPDFSNFS